MAGDGEEYIASDQAMFLSMDSQFTQDVTMFAPGSSSPRASAFTSSSPQDVDVWGSLRRKGGQQEEIKLQHRVGKDGKRDTFTIGRNAQSNDIIVADKRVSSNHCSIYLDYSEARVRVFLQDTSANGTYINDTSTRVGRNERIELKSGDEIFLIHPGHAPPNIMPHTSNNEDCRNAAFMFVNIRERIAIQRNIAQAPESAIATTGRELLENSQGVVSERVHVEDKYVIGEQIGSGMCGSVHFCVEKSTGEQYAVKIIDTKKFHINPGLSANDIREEALMMRNLEHPNIVAIKDTFEMNSNIFIVMELVKGGDLFDRIIARSRYNEENARLVMKQVLSAVLYLHENQIIHRDLKPENILLVSKTDDTNVKITDFGLAKRANQEGLKTFCGTPQYFAPEVLQRKSTVKGTGSYGTSADMWSLGVVLFILLSGSFPFEEEQLFSQIEHAEYKLEGSDWKGISDGAKHLVRSLMTLKPESRITVQQALLHPWLNGEVFDLKKYTLKQAQANLKSSSSSVFLKPYASSMDVPTGGGRKRRGSFDETAAAKKASKLKSFRGGRGGAGGGGNEGSASMMEQYLNVQSPSFPAPKGSTAASQLSQQVDKAQDSQPSQLMLEPVLVVVPPPIDGGPIQKVRSTDNLLLADRKTTSVKSPSPSKSKSKAAPHSADSSAKKGKRATDRGEKGINRGSLETFWNINSTVHTNGVEGDVHNGHGSSAAAVLNDVAKAETGTGTAIDGVVDSTPSPPTGQPEDTVAVVTAETAKEPQEGQEDGIDRLVADKSTTDASNAATSSYNASSAAAAVQAKKIDYSSHSFNTVSAQGRSTSGVNNLGVFGSTRPKHVEKVGSSAADNSEIDNHDSDAETMSVIEKNENVLLNDHNANSYHTATVVNIDEEKNRKGVVKDTKSDKKMGGIVAGKGKEQNGSRKLRQPVTSFSDIFNKI